MLWMAAAGLAAWAAIAAAGAGGPVTVSAAVSLNEVLQDVALMYERRGGGRIVLNTGASTTLARQIAAGARVDIFISADPAQMDLVASRLVPGTRRELLSNQMAIVVPADRFRRWGSPRDLLAPSVRRVAIGDPAGVPAGVYARGCLQQLQLWDALQPKLIPAGTVRLALAAVENGAADAAIVYRTDTAVARGAREAFVFDVSQCPRIAYPAAAVRDGPNPDGARRFLTFLESEEASALFRRAGFVPLAQRRTRNP